MPCEEYLLNISFHLYLYIRAVTHFVMPFTFLQINSETVGTLSRRERQVLPKASERYKTTVFEKKDEKESRVALAVSS